jgi:hypothetical protein
MTTRNAYPLTWPQGWKRHTTRGNPLFDRRTIEQCVREILNQLRLLKIRDYEVILSSNLILRNDGLPRGGQPNPFDPGAAVYFRLNGQERVLACDKWARVEDNLWAIGKHIDSVRAQDRWGVGNVAQAFAGYTALMSGREVRPWHIVLEVAELSSTETVLDSFRLIAKRVHPDVQGGSHEKMSELNEALASFKKERGIA